jgi:hypothetical protein
MGMVLSTSDGGFGDDPNGPAEWRTFAVRADRRKEGGGRRLPSALDPGTLRRLGWLGEEATMERQGDRLAHHLGVTREAHGAPPRRAPEYTRCDACGEGMQSMGHCKWLCRACGFLRTCIDTV